ncbi:DEHA2E18590p [Debaryomyces hansenii CBS767]|uniref:DEHA2E18590p n=1 Tax=Debaryomyces hansenii (strain ATCC 36239 / CBS 767 / BCRC 21394 / JCM 1990 / NBRC 0083 / IGC 2968) TaxID=284592 RepID=Q6BNW0_DEBHA|nr:DEHA2E18590p [Debaryomyces hansenii CBS767]CAG88380.2 DEHA2E18590p [Debaryomyces hansenii CBS767]|eukprot:XP_460110.2 DEHA2E18590p [Debaryomyces hansenii CBS767]
MNEENTGTTYSNMSSDTFHEFGVLFDRIQPYLTSLWAICIGAYILFSISTRINDRILMKKLGAKPMQMNAPNSFWGIPLMFRLLKAKREGTMVDVTKERYKELGVDTFNVNIAGTHAVVTRDPENIKAILATQFNDFALGKRHTHFKPLLGDGIFTLDGAGWKHSRTMLRPQFAREKVAHVKALEPHLQTLAKHIINSKGERFDIQPLFFRLTIDSATEFLFGESVENLHDESVGLTRDPVDFDGKSGFADAFNTSQTWLASRAVTQNLYFLVDGRSFRSSNAKVHKFADYYVRKALEASSEDLEKASRDGYIFLYELVKQTRDPVILRDQLLNILLAGRDTTAGLLSFTFFELARNQDVYDKLKEEIYEKFGEGEDSRVDEITFESLKKCEFLKCVLNEILRMYPSVPQNFRFAIRNTTLPKGGGPDGKSPIFVSKGKNLFYSMYSAHRNPKYYGKDAEEFRPSRWLEPEIRKVGWAFLPFNGGPRICLGQQFALTGASYIVVRLIQMFPNLSSFCEEYPPRKNTQLTMSHQNGVYIGMF